MIIAIPASQDHRLMAHFGKAEGFLVYAVEAGRILGVDWRPVATTDPTGDCGHSGEGGCGAGPRFTCLAGCHVLGVVGIGTRAKAAVMAQGTRVLAVPPGLDPAAAALLCTGQRAMAAPQPCVCTCGSAHGLT